MRSACNLFCVPCNEYLGNKSSSSSSGSISKRAPTKDQKKNCPFPDGQRERRSRMPSSLGIAQRDQIFILLCAQEQATAAGLIRFCAAAAD